MMERCANCDSAEPNVEWAENGIDGQCPECGRMYTKTCYGDSVRSGPVLAAIRKHPAEFAANVSRSNVLLDGLMKKRR